MNLLHPIENKIKQVKDLNGIWKFRLKTYTGRTRRKSGVKNR